VVQHEGCRTSRLVRNQPTGNPKSEGPGNPGPISFGSTGAQVVSLRSPILQIDTKFYCGNAKKSRDAQPQPLPRQARNAH
jgi:hypothetical protein